MPSLAASLPVAAATTSPVRSRGVDVVDRRDPVAVARRYVQLRWTYSWQDPAGVAAAYAADEVSTAAFAARSTPSRFAVQDVLQARDEVSVWVTAASLDAEAPQSTGVRRVDVAFTRWESFRGATGPHPDPALWTLRLVSASEGWRVDGVENGR